MDRKRIMLTDKEILVVRNAIRHEIYDKEDLIKILYGTECDKETFIKGEIEALKSAVNKLDAASYGKKGK